MVDGNQPQITSEEETRIADGENETSIKLQEAAVDSPIVSTSSSALKRSSTNRLETSCSHHSSCDSSRDQMSRHQTSTSIMDTGKTDNQVPTKNQAGNPNPSDEHDDNINANTASGTTTEIPGALIRVEAIAESYRREFEDLLERDERGESIDEVRLYFLELYARQMVGEQLDVDETRDLAEFENNEIYRLTLGTQVDDVDTTSKAETTGTGIEVENEKDAEAAGDFVVKLNAETTDPSVKPLMQQILEDDINSLVPSQPLATAKTMKSNSNVYEIDPPCRLTNLTLLAGDKTVKPESVLSNVDASLYRLKQGTALHKSNIRQEYYAEKRELQNFRRLSATFSNSEKFSANQNNFPHRSHMVSNPRVLIARAGTKLLNTRKSNRRNHAVGGAAYNESRRQDRRRQKQQTSDTARRGPRMAVPATQFESKEAEHIVGGSSRHQVGEKAKTRIGLNRKQGRNRNGSLRRRVHKSQTPLVYNDRRKLAHIKPDQTGSNSIQQLPAFDRSDGTSLAFGSSCQQPAVSSPEHHRKLSRKSIKASTQKSVIAPSQPCAEIETRKNKTSRYSMQEMVADRQNSLLSQLNQVSPLSKNISTSNSAPAATPQNSKAISVLQQNGGQLSTKHRKIYSSIRNERFLMATDLAYDRIVKGNHRLELLFSIAEWRHVHVLMLYARLFQCELLAENIYQPKEFSIYLPDTLQIFEPLGIVIASIGVVEDKEFGLSYVPVARPLQGGKYKPHDPSDVTVFMEWSQYKWNASWTQVKVERARRKSDAQSRGIEIPEQQEKNSSNHSKLPCWEHLALEIWLGWDEELWLSYELFVESVRRSFLFVDFPRSPAGTYAWLIPSYRTGSGSYAKIPNPTIGSAVWMISLLFDLSDLPPQSTASWFCTTDTIADIQATLLQFLDSAAKN